MPSEPREQVAARAVPCIHPTGCPACAAGKHCDTCDHHEFSNALKQREAREQVEREIAEKLGFDPAKGYRSTTVRGLYAMAVDSELARRAAEEQLSTLRANVSKSMDWMARATRAEQELERVRGSLRKVAGFPDMFEMYRYCDDLGVKYDCEEPPYLTMAKLARAALSQSVGNNEPLPTDRDGQKEQP